jgi:uncharacterized membrane protein
MPNLVAAAAFFLLIHLLVSGTRVREVLVGRIGEGAYMGLFSLASAVGLIWLILAFGDARGEPQAAFWTATPASRPVQIVVQLPALLLIVVGLTTRNPTSVRQEGALQRPDVVQGVLRITRHPFLWGVALWAAGHLMVNGEPASLVLFGTLLVLSVAGTFSIDAKRRRALGDAWAPFAAATSNLPFGRGLHVSVREIGLWRLLLGLVIWAGLLLAHPHLFGVPALP